MDVIMISHPRHCSLCHIFLSSFHIFLFYKQLSFHILSLTQLSQEHIHNSSLLQNKYIFMAWKIHECENTLTSFHPSIFNNQATCIHFPIVHRSNRLLTVRSPLGSVNHIYKRKGGI